MSNMHHEESCCSDNHHHHENAPHEEAHHNHPHAEGKQSPGDYWPLMVVVLFALGMAALSHDTMNMFMGYFFVLLAMFKFFDLKGFADGFQMYDLLAKPVRAYAFLYPMIELFLGFCFLSGNWPLFTNVATMALMIFSGAGVLKHVLSGSKIKCACLGTALNVPLSTVSIIENGGMALMAAVNIFIAK